MALLITDFLEKTKHLADDTIVMTNSFKVDSDMFVPEHSNTVHAMEDYNTIILAEKIGGGWIDKSDLTLGELKEIINNNKPRIKDISLDDEDRSCGFRDADDIHIVNNVILIV